MKRRAKRLQNAGETSCKSAGETSVIHWYEFLPVMANKSKIRHFVNIFLGFNQVSDNMPYEYVIAENLLTNTSVLYGVTTPKKTFSTHR